MFFGNWKIEKSDMKVRIGELEKELAGVKQQLANSNKVIDDINNELRDTEFALDFNIFRVFSIERNVSNNKPCTIIGYYMNEPVISSDGEMVVNRDVVKEWTLYCSDRVHRKLIDEFNQHKAQ